MFDKEKTCNGGKERKSDGGIKAKTGHRLWDVLTFTGVTVAVGGSQPLQLYCHRHKIVIIIVVIGTVVVFIVIKRLFNYLATDIRSSSSSLLSLSSS